jgi:hypothetical protein
MVEKIYGKEIMHHIYIPRGEEGGDRKVVDDPARTAEYTTDKIVVKSPNTRVVVDTAVEWLCKPLHA